MSEAILSIINALIHEHRERTGHRADEPWPGYIMPDNGCQVCFWIRSALRAAAAEQEGGEQ